MEAFVKELQMQLEKEFDAISHEATPVKGYDIRIELVEMAIIRMKEYASDHPFPNKEQEIQYFKCWSLPFIKLHIYFVTMYNLESVRLTTDKDEFVAFIQSEKKRIGAYVMAHQELYRYYKAGRTDEDEKYFTFRLPSRTSDFLIANSSFCGAGLILGELLAYEEYRIVLENEIDRITAPDRTYKKIEIKVPRSAVAEIITPIYELQWIWIDGRPATLNELIRMAERGFGIDLKDFSVLDNANRCRKKSPNPYLELILQASKNRRDRLDPRK